MHIIITLHLCSFPLQDGDTALDMARRRQKFDIVKLLTDANHKVCTWNFTGCMCISTYLRDIARPSCLATLTMISLDNEKHTVMISLIFCYKVPHQFPNSMAVGFWAFSLNSNSRFCAFGKELAVPLA